MIVLGLISGTSADGIDAALLEVGETRGNAPAAPTCRLIAHATTPYDAGLREQVLAAASGTGAGAEALSALHVALGEAFGQAAIGLMRDAGVDATRVAAVGSHGQTVWHCPPAGGRRGWSLQIGDPATIAAVTGCAVVADFRAADLAAGGHGAPLVPFADRVLFGRPDGPTTVLNVGGMANVTWIPSLDGGGHDVVAFDTGPGNALMDAAAALATGGRARCDRDGALAARGTVDRALLARLRSDAFFAESPPRSTGRERFGPAMVGALAAERGLGSAGDAGWTDLLATLTALTAETVVEAIERWVRPREPGEVVVTGGGAHNPTLMAALREAGAATEPALAFADGRERVGALSDAREAAAFALLAWAHLRGLPGNVPAATGASGPRVLGSLTPAPEGP